MFRLKTVTHYKKYFNAITFTL